MGDEGRRPIRRMLRAKRAISPKVRGQYRRSVHAARLRGEAQPAEGAESPQQSRAKVSAVARRRIAPWVFVVALLPILLLATVGAYAINIVLHTERAITKAQASPLPPRPTQVAIANAPSNTPRPTNTPNPLGTVEPIPTDTAIPATVDPIAAVNFDRKDPLTIMLLGVDTREGDTDSRSDTILLLYIDPSNADDTVHLLSVPRDLLVTMAGGFGQGKMADVYSTGQQNHYLESAEHPNVGGPALVRDTLEQNFRIQIDFYAQVDFNGFRKIVDTIGGVTVDNPYPFKDSQYPTEDYQFTRVYFPAGTMHLYGEEALEFARSRYGDDDYARNARQQQVILGIRQQALQLNLLSKATDLIDALGDSVRTDFPLKAQGLAFAKFGVGVKGSAIHQYSLTDLLGVCANCNGFFATIDWQKARDVAKQFSPKENKDFIAAQANDGLNRGATIVIENGTNTVGIASGWSATFQRQGFANSSFIDAPAGTKGKVPQTQILYFAPENEKTAQSLAQTMGLTVTPVRSTGARPPEARNADILIVLGNDARSP
jgi:LCP family protein required for cell wall assembly